MIRSIKSKIVLWNVLIFVVALSAIEIFTYLTVKTQLYKDIDLLLQSECMELDGQLVYEASTLRIVYEDEWNELEHTQFGDHAIYIYVFDEGGDLIRASHNAKFLNLTHSPAPSRLSKAPQFSNYAQETSRFRRLDFPVMRETVRVGTLSALVSLKYIDNFLGYSKRMLLLFLPVFILLSLFGIRAIVKRSLKPLADIAGTARSIMRSGNLKHRVDESADDSEIRGLIETLNELFGRLERSFDSIAHFAAEASHELRTPLTILRGNIEVALAQPRSEGAYRQTLESLWEETLKMSMIVNNLLYLSRIESPVSRQLSELVLLDKLVEQQLQNYRTVIENQEMRLVSAVEPDIEILGNGARISEVLVNLIDNAIKFTSSNGEIRVRLYKSENKVVLEVEDNGPGIPEHSMDKIFERFYRVRGDDRGNLPGSGIGLAIVQRIIEEHHAEIKVENIDPHGTRFRVYFDPVEYE